jgi:GH15 family glucan-1,4-alpha-glucosidase
MKIEDYAVIGDTQTIALVGKSGSIDWLCLPRFDSGACFAALLGSPQNGRWLLAPAGEVTKVERRYRPGSLVLETDFHTPEGVVRVVDCMPLRGKYPDVVRQVQGLSGTVRMRLELVIRFDYGHIVPWVKKDDGLLHAIAGPDALVLRTPVPTHGKDLTTAAELSVRAGERVPFALTWYPSHERPPEAVDVDRAIDETDQFWRTWSSRCHERGAYREDVVRSLLTLKALTYAPTGGIVAAGTASLPEALGGTRNWDYRYCWLRDATFTLYAMLHAGYREEAAAWRDWLLRAVAGDPSKLQIMYGASGERRLDERTIDWLDGYEGSRPVRIGNAAAGQLQLDVYGEVLDALHQARREGIPPEAASWQLQCAICNWLESNWTQPDEGLWEVRGPRRDFTHSKMMAWVAMDRAVKAVEQHGMTGPVERWRGTRDEIHRDVCSRGYDADLGSFTQSYGDKKLDASLLLMPSVGFLPARDPRVLGTIAAIEKTLMREGLVLRYLTRDGSNEDGLAGREGAFLACSFWLADAYLLSGRREDARRMFDRLLSLRNDVGLLSEEYDVERRRLVGNFPQAFSHVALVNTARSLGGSGGPVQARHET